RQCHRRRHRALDEAAAEHARLAVGRVVERAGLPGRHAVLAGDEIDLDAAGAAAQPGRLRRPGGAHLDEDLVPAGAQRTVDAALAQPVDLAQPHPAGAQGIARPDHDAPRGGVEPDHVERTAGGDAKPATLTDGEMDDAGMAAEHAAVEIDDVAGLGGPRLEPFDHLAVAAGGDEADVLAVMLVGDRQAEPARKLAGLGLGLVAEREAQEIKLLAGGGEQEIALVALLFAGAIKAAAAAWQRPRRDVMAGRQHLGAELARGDEQIAELDRLVALYAWHRRLAGDVAFGKAV